MLRSMLSITHSPLRNGDLVFCLLVHFRLACIADSFKGRETYNGNRFCIDFRFCRDGIRMEEEQLVVDN